MKKKICIATLICGLFIGLTGCGNSDVMVLTPYGDAVIRDEGASAGTTTAKATQQVAEPAAKEETAALL